MTKLDKFFVSLLSATLYILLLASNKAQDQVVEDNTLSTEVETENGRNFTINSGEQRGDNLFHSFDEFSIPATGSIFFNNATSIENIISRVTGSSVSDINGLIRSNGTANLFLINPNGIIFGENATLDIGGSFIGTTAESLLFEDGTEFSTNLDNSQSLLTVSVPLGLQFGSDPGEITNKANFSINNPLDPNQQLIKVGLATPGKTFGLFSGNITFDGGAATSSMGNIELGSVSQNSFVALKAIPEGWKASYDSVSLFGDIKFDNLASVDVSGAGGGNINITGKSIQILNGSAITSNTLGNIDGGTIQIQASNLLEINGSDISDTRLDSFLTEFEIFLPFSSQISSNTFGTGKGGDISITAQNLKLIDGSSIELQTFPRSTTAGGNLSIVATDSIELSGVRPLLAVGENASNLIISEVSLDAAIDINQGSEISTASISSGSAGDIDIVADSISLKDGATIAATPFRTGEGGFISIDAESSVEIIGTSPRTGSYSSSIAATTLANGNAGDLDLSTDKLSIRDGGLLISATANEGDAGNINIRTSTTEINGFRDRDGVPSLISTQTLGGTGDGGDIFLNTDRLIISDRGSLSVRGAGQSVPGNLTVNAKEIELNNFASITAETEFESGGNIELNVSDNLTLRENSLISAQAFNNASGGNLSIDANFIVAFPQQNNDILANAEFGNGGNINIVAEGILGLEERPSLLSNQTNDIDASSEFGDAGTVELEFPDDNSDNTLTRLDSDYVDVEYLFKNSFCKVRDRNQFVATGRGGIPQMPDDRLLPEHTWADWRIVEESESTATAEVEPARTVPKQINLVRGWVRDSSGNIVLTDKPLIAASPASGLNSPDCNDLKQDR